MPPTLQERCIATPALAHVGFAEAIFVIQQMLGESPLPIDYAKVPWAIYCNPEVAFAGHTEESARAAGREVTQAKDLPTPIDFPPAPDGHAHLKSVLVTLK